MLVPIVGVVAGGAVAVASIPIVSRVADRITPDHEGFGLYEVLLGCGIFGLGLIGSGIAVAVVRSVRK